MKNAPRKRNSPGPTEELEAWANFVSRLVCLVFGLMLITFDAAFMQDEPVTFRIVLAFVGAAFCGPVIGRTLSGILSAWKGGGPEQ